MIVSSPVSAAAACFRGRPDIRARRATTFAVAFLVALAACGASARDKAIKGTLVSLNATGDGVLEYSRRREAAIVAAATSEADGQAKLATFREHVDRVMAVLGLAYHALEVAVDKGTPLDRAMKLATEVAAAAAALKEDTSP